MALHGVASHGVDVYVAQCKKLRDKRATEAVASLERHTDSSTISMTHIISRPYIGSIETISEVIKKLRRRFCAYRPI